MSEKQTISTTIYKADVSNFKANLSKARDELKMVNAQFKASTASMDDWKRDSEGLEAKLKQLSDTIELQKDILENYEKQLEEVQKTKAKNVDASEKLRKEMQALEKSGKQNTTIYTYYAKQLQKAEKELEKNAKQEYNLKTQILNTQTAIGKAERETRDYTDTLEKLEAGLLDVSDEVDEAGDGFTVLKGTMANLAASGAEKALEIIAEAARKVAEEMKKAVEAADQLDDSLDSFSAQTGIDLEKNPEYEKAIREIWKSGRGEDIQDVASAMAKIKQTTGKDDAKELQELTANALLARDTFEWDIQEQIRAADMLMKEFGVTGAEAYALMIQGAQSGLDKNNDLLDTINEYGVHFSQLGYSAEDMFNMLVNGAEQGAFSVDKLGDAVKEFGIRAVDNSDSTKEAMAELGLCMAEVTDSAEDVAEYAEKIAKIDEELAELDTSSSKVSVSASMKYEQKLQKNANDIEKVRNQIKAEQQKQLEWTDKTKESTKTANANKIKDLQNQIKELEAERAILEQEQSEKSTGTSSSSSKRDKLLAEKEELQRQMGAAQANIAAAQTGTSYGDFAGRFMAGDTSAIQETLDALMQVEDAVKRNELGVALFGTMWEDLGAEAIQALLNTQGEIDKTSDALQKIEELHFDDLDMALEALGRTITDSLYIPLGEKLTPAIGEFVREVSSGFEQAGNDSEQLKEVFLDALDGLREALEEMLPELKDNGAVIVETIVESLLEMLPLLVEVGIQFVLALVKGLVGSVDKLPAAAIDLVGAFVAGVIDCFMEIDDLGFDIIEQLVRSLGNAGSALVEAGKRIARSLIDGIKDYFLDNPLSNFIVDSMGRVETVSSRVQSQTSGLRGSTTGSSGAGRNSVTNNTRTVAYSPTFNYNKPLNSKEIYRQNKNMLNNIVGVN